METTDPTTPPGAETRVNRRAFIRTTGVAAAMAGGIEGILAARRAPAFAQGTKLHHALYPLAGAAGQFPLYFSNGHGLMKYSKNPKLAKDFLRWLHKPEHFDRWFQVCDGYSVAATTHWEKSAMWDRIDKPLQMFRTAARNTRIFGFAGPSSGKATEAFSKYIVVDMYAKAVQGMKAEDAVKWAEGELKKVYES